MAGVACRPSDPEHYSNGDSRNIRPTEKVSSDAACGSPERKKGGWVGGKIYLFATATVRREKKVNNRALDIDKKEMSFLFGKPRQVLSSDLSLFGARKAKPVEPTKEVSMTSESNRYDSLKSIAENLMREEMRKTSVTGMLVRESCCVCVTALLLTRGTGIKAVSGRGADGNSRKNYPKPNCGARKPGFGLQGPQGEARAAGVRAHRDASYQRRSQGDNLRI